MELYSNTEFKILAPKYTVYNDLYEADHAVVTSSNYLIRHALETQTQGHDLLRLRVARTRYRNFIEPIISAFVAMAFKQPIDVSEVTDIFTDDVIANIDGKNTTLTNFIKNCVAKDYFLFGQSYILTDAPANPTRAYWQSLSPLSVPDWQNEAYSTEFNALRYEYYEARARRDLETEEMMVLKSRQYLLSNTGVIAQEYEKSGKDWEKVGAPIDLQLNKVPVAKVTKNKSWVHDACEEALRYHNLLSMRDNVLNHQGYQRSYIAGEMDDNSSKLVNEYVTGILPTGAQVFTVDSADTTGIEKALDQSQTAVFQIAFNMQRVLPFDSKGIQGEGTIAENKKELRDLIITAIQEINDVVNVAVQHFAMFNNKPDYEGKIKFSTDLTIEDIDTVLKTLPITKPYSDKMPIWKKSIVRKLIKSQQLPEQDEILKELETADLSEPKVDSGLDSFASGNR